MHMQNILSVTGTKITKYACNRFHTSFCNKDHKTYKTISCYTILHQDLRGEGKNSLRKREDILVSDCDLYFIILTNF